jgi:predicted RNA-binding protein associated with RNAse of E/G family
LRIPYGVLRKEYEIRGTEYEEELTWLSYNTYMSPSHPITIHLARIGKSTRSFTEGFVQDDGTRLTTFTIVPPDVRASLSAHFRAEGRFAPDQFIATVTKHLFYNEYFSIVEFRDEAGEVLGYYCDIVTPLARVGEAYCQTDLLLDLWVSPGGDYQVLDEDEFEEAVEEGLLSDELRVKAVGALERLKDAIAGGRFLFL